MRRNLALVLCGCLLFCGLCGCGEDGSGKGFRFPLEAEPQQLDPQVAADTASVAVCSVLFEGLTRLDEEGQPQPGAADWTVSADGRVYTFTLRESYWSTVSLRGEATGFEEPVLVTADDFVFGLQRAADPQTGSSLSGELAGIAGAAAVLSGEKSVEHLGVRAVDERTLTITLTEPDDSFPTRLAAAPFMPCNREFFAYTAGRYGLETRYVLTNGPFSLTAWNHDESLLLNKNEQYHDAENVLPAAVRLVIGGGTLEELKNGEMDAVALTAEETEAARRAGVQVEALQDTVRSLWFNTREESLSNGDVRRALRDAVEWDTVYAYLEELGETPADGYVAPAAMNRSSPTVGARLCCTDVAAAQKALGAGLAALYPEDRTPALPTLTVLAAEDEASANLARYLIQSWQKNLQLKCRLTLVSEEQLLSRLKSGNYQLAVAAVTAQGLSAGENLCGYLSANSQNYSGYADSGLDAALEKAQKGGRDALVAAEERLAQACPTVPLSFQTRYYGIAAGNGGIRLRPFNGGAYGSPFSFLQATKKD